MAGSNTNTLNSTTTTSNSFGTPSFKLSDILNVGDFFGNPGAGKGAKRADAINAGVDAAGAGAMTYFSANRGGNNALQKRGSNADAAFDAASSAAQFIPVAGPVLSLAMQGFQLGMQNLAPKLKGPTINSSIGGSSAFGGLANSISNQSSDINAYNKAGVGKFFMNKSNLENTTADLNKQQTMGVSVLRNNQKLLQASGANTNRLNSINLINFNGGIPSVPVGKNGLNTAFIKSFNENKISRFKEGGPINVIVNGKLHSQRHEIGGIVDVPITGKGVPVITETKEEGGQIEQAAELERDEIILHLDLTKKLEELKQENTDESMIEAGKILSKEILKNTKDSKSKLLKTVV